MLIIPKVDFDSEEKSGVVEREGNHIYFYENVNSDSAFKLIKELRRLDAELIADRVRCGVAHSTPIHLHIHSYGGSAFAGQSLHHQVRSTFSPVYTYVEGVCASAATFISLAGVKRFIEPGAFMLIHQLSSSTWFYTYEECKDEMRLLNALMELAVEIYVDRTKLDDESIRDLLKRDTWLTAQECLEYAFVEEISCSPGK